jgi:hypothetical protein
MPGMSEPQKKPGWAFWACAVAATTVLLLGAYAGTYTLMVTPIQVFNFDPSGMGDDAPAGYAVPWYADSPESRAHELLKTAFSPAHEIDRLVRPSVWGRLP